MANLRTLLAAHAPLLLLDAASARVQVGWLERDGPARWADSTEESGVGLFQALAALSVSPAAAGGFVFCEGPGSILGIRTTAMAVRTWCVLRSRPIFCYTSLALVAHAMNQPDLAVIADARRDTWHHFQLGVGLSRRPTNQLSGPLAMPEGFRHWSPLPSAVATIPYKLSELLPATAAADLFQATDAPDAFLHEEPAYVTWTPQVHQAPAR